MLWIDDEFGLVFENDELQLVPQPKLHPYSLKSIMKDSYPSINTVFFSTH